MLRLPYRAYSRRETFGKLGSRARDARRTRSMARRTVQQVDSAPHDQEEGVPSVAASLAGQKFQMARTSLLKHFVAILATQA